MNIIPQAKVVVTDQMRMTGLVLSALESGRLPMHATDYRDIAAAAIVELSCLETSELIQLVPSLPHSLHALVDKVLSERSAYRFSTRSYQSDFPDPLEFLP